MLSFQFHRASVLVPNFCFFCHFPVPFQLKVLYFAIFALLVFLSKRSYAVICKKESGRERE